MTKYLAKIVSITRSLRFAGATLVVALLLLTGSLLTFQPTRAQGGEP